MAKIGRNDPCHCGSGKKFKKCCMGKSSSPFSGLGEKTMSFEQARQITENLLGQNLAGPLKGNKGKRLKLILDEYALEEAVALAQVKALGKASEDRVAFYDGKQLVGEADLSIAGKVLVTTSHKKEADRLKTQLSRISGLTFLTRTEDELDALDDVDTNPAESLLDFKRQFFQAWPDEPNERLQGQTPRQAVQDPALKPKLLKLLDDLEKKEAKLPKKERFKFASVRKALGL